MLDHPSVAFFDQQFQRQIGAEEFALNPFETVALPHLTGRVLDYGCGLGNLAIAAARQACQVEALDASPHNHAGKSALRLRKPCRVSPIGQPGTRSGKKGG